MELLKNSMIANQTNLFKMNPEIKVMNLDMVDFSKMNVFEIKDFISECLKDLKANWDIIPDGKYDQELMDHLKASYKGKANYHGHVVEEAQLLDMFIDKKHIKVILARLC